MFNSSCLLVYSFSADLANEAERTFPEHRCLVMAAPYAATFSNTVDVIGVAMEFLFLVVRLKLRCTSSRWNLAVRESVRQLKCKGGVTNAVVRALPGAFPEVRALSLSFCVRVRASGLFDLVRLGGLVALDLSWTLVTDADLECLPLLVSLASVNLQCCKHLTSEACAPLARIKHLRALNVRSINSCVGLPFLDHLVERAPQLTSLSVGESFVTPDAMARLQRFPRLTSLTASTETDFIRPPMTDASLEQLAAVRGLTSVDLICSVGISEGGFARMCGRLHGLTALTLWRCTTIAFIGLPPLPALTSLVVGRSRVGLAGVEAICRSTGLESLRFSMCLEVCDDCLDRIGSSLCRLTSLSLYTAVCVSDAGVARLAPLAGKLRSLRLEGCHRVSDASLVTIGAFQRLTSLSLANNLSITNDGLAHIAVLPTLRLLNVRNCWKMTPDGIRQHPRLQAASDAHADGLCSE